MKNAGKLLFCLLGMVVLTPVAVVRANVAESAGANTDAAGSDTPYSAIWTRNIFDLKPKDPPPANNSALTAAPPSNVKLMGILNIGKKEAVLSVQEQPVPGQPRQPQPINKEEYYTLSEGQRHGALEVLEINPKARTVKIKNDELVSTITFETNHFSGPANAPQNMGGPHPNQFPGTVPFNNPAPQPLPGRMMRGGAPFAAQGYGQPMAAGMATGMASGYRGPTSNLSPEEQVANMLIQKTAAENAGRPYPPLPNMPLPGMGQNGNTGGDGTSSNPSPGIPNYRPQLPSWIKPPQTTGTFPPVPH